MTKIQSTGRDTAIDVIRALALLTIFVNHVPGNPIEFLTHKNFGFSDAAEAFVLISGISAGFAYGSKFISGNWLVTTLKAWRRAGVLYFAQLSTTLFTLAVFALVAMHFHAPEILAEHNIGMVMEKPAEALFGIVTLGHQLGYNNILSMYACVLLIVPPLLLVGYFNLLAMVVLSGAIWFFSGLLHIAPPNFPTEGQWFLNPLSWQFLFVIGMAATIHVKRGGEVRAAPVLVGLCVAYLVGSLVWVKAQLWGLETALDLPVVLSGFDKTYLSLPRLLHVLSIAYLLVVLPRVLDMLRLPRGNPLTVVGMHSLPVFVVGTVLAMAAQAWRAANGTTVPGDIVILVVGIGLQLALAYYLEWYATLKQRPAPAAKPAAPALRPRAIRLPQKAAEAAEQVPAAVAVRTRGPVS
jgi:hypothetical protein